MASLEDKMRPYWTLANLKFIRKNAGLTQEQVARDLDVPLSTYRNWEQEKNSPTAENMTKLSAYFTCSPEDFVLVGSDPNNPKFKMIDVPLYGSIAAGDPIYMNDPDELPEEWFSVPSVLVNKYESCFLLKVKGNSMNRVLPNGSYALVAPSRKEPVIDNHAYAVCVNGYDATIKRVKKLANGIELIPDSIDPTYKPKVYDYGLEETETITIIGEIVWYTIPFDFQI